MPIIFYVMLISIFNVYTVQVCDFGLSRLKHNTFLSSKSTAGTVRIVAFLDKRHVVLYCHL